MPEKDSEMEVIALFDQLVQLSEILLESLEAKDSATKDYTVSDLTRIHQMMHQRGRLIEDLLIFPYQTLSPAYRSLVEQKLFYLQSLDPQLQTQLKEKAQSLAESIHDLRETKSVIARYKLSLMTPFTQSRMA